MVRVHFLLAAKSLQSFRLLMFSEFLGMSQIHQSRRFSRKRGTSYTVTHFRAWVCEHLRIITRFSHECLHLSEYCSRAVKEHSMELDVMKSFLKLANTCLKNLYFIMAKLKI